MLPPADSLKLPLELLPLALLLTAPESLELPLALLLTAPKNSLELPLALLLTAPEN
jgi:hypothetical protein